mmetsp:Transcript_54494/g.108174  ORF Transcript_54494/g.108174 Transcript_54494/m.108174 type:complete len:534 (-) Transcript_54494:149-1750(-)
MLSKSTAVVLEEKSPLRRQSSGGSSADEQQTLKDYEAFRDFYSKEKLSQQHHSLASTPEDQGGQQTSHRTTAWPTRGRLRAGYRDFIKSRALVLGFGLGASSTMLLVSVFIMWVSYDPRSGAIHELVNGYYAIFRAAFLVAYWALIFGTAQFIWRRCNVNYHAPLGISRDVTYTSTFTVVFSSFFLVFGSFIVFVLQLIAPAMFTQPLQVLPLVALVSPLALLLWPTDRPPLFFFVSPGSAASHRFLFGEVLATVLAPWHSPTFLRTFIADVLCSMPKLFMDLLFSGCLYYTGDFEGGLTGQCSVKGSRAYGLAADVLAVLPFFLRLCQSLRGVLDNLRRDTGKDATPRATRKHLLNSTKYAASISLVVVSIAKGNAPPAESTQGLDQAWLLLSVGCTAFNFFWDVAVDWAVTEISWPRPGVGDSEEEESASSPSSRLARALNTVPAGRCYPAWVYAAAVVFNGLARFGWAVYVSPRQTVVAQHTILLLAALELTRRGVWSVLRVELEYAKSAEGERELRKTKEVFLEAGPFL